jgi:hypothetical protein
MTKEEIIEMARQSGVRDDEHIFEFSQYKYLEAFAKLVAEKEREACANICETLELPNWPDKVRQPLAQAIRARGENK